MAKAKGITPEQVEKEFFQTVRPSSLLQRFATTDERLRPWSRVLWQARFHPRRTVPR